MLRRLRVPVVLSVVLVAGGASAWSQDNPAEQQLDPEQLQKLFEEFAKPGEEHARFKQFAGEWNAECKNFERPDQPTVTEATAKFDVLLGGRFLRQTFQGTFNGQSFRGIGINGYDKTQQKYTGVWIDTMGTGIMHTTGEYDAATKTLTETAETSSPIGPMKMKMVTKEIDADKFQFTMYMVQGDGAEMKSMEITYTRKKAE